MINNEFNEIVEDNNILNIETKRLTATEIVILNIKNQIISRALQPGDKLPNETMLSKEIGVSRGSIREAMKILSTNGIVEVRRGHGTYIADSTDRIVLNPLLFKLIMSQKNINELRELREMIEIGIINFAIRNRTQEDIEVLEAAYIYMEEKYKDLEYFDEVIVDCELRFHYALGKATKNKLVQTIYNVVLDLYIPNIYKSKLDKRFVREALECHRPIIDAIKERDIQKGESAIKHSVDIWKSQSETE